MAKPNDLGAPKPNFLDRLMPWRVDRRRIEEHALAKALDAFVGAVASDEQLAKSFNMGNGGVMPGTSWSNQGGPGVQSRLLSRVTQNLAQNFKRPVPELEAQLAQQGLSWGPPFPPGRPLDPFWGYRRPPRTFDFSVGENVQLSPRHNRVSFQTIKALWDAYDVAQICTKHLINDVRSLDYHFEASLGVREDVSEDIITARRFFDSPDKRQPFRSWLAEWLIDVIRYDAGCLYIRRNKVGDPIALEVVNGTTMIPIIDYFGRIATDENDEDPNLTAAGTFHGEVVPAFLQIIEGMPWDWLASDDIVYQPLNPQPDSQYGLAPLEAVLLTANTDIRFQWHFLQFFTAGTLPAGFMEAPEGLSDPSHIAEFQSVWDAVMTGDQAKLRQIRWVPFGAKFQPIGPSAIEFDSEFPLYLMRRTCAAHGVTPADLGFTETVNKATSEVQVDVQFRVGTLPIVRHVEDVINLFITEHLKLRVRLRFDTGREIEDRLSTAQAEAIYIDKGVISPDEPRARLGYPVSQMRPTPRFVQNARSGPIPLIGIESMSGPIDPETFGPTVGAPLIDHPFHEVPGVMPPIGSRAYSESQNAAALMQENMIAQGSGGGTGQQIGGNKPANERYGSEGGPKEGDQIKVATPKPAAASKPKPKVKKSKTEVFGSGIAVVAKDTGRTLMLQRSYADERKKAAGKWEFPGGIPEDIESHWDAAKREWEEETGNKLPAKGRVIDSWKSAGYTLFVYLIKFESDILLNPDRDDMQVKDPDHPNSFQTETTAWWEIDQAQDAGKAIRKDLRDFDWDILRRAAKEEVTLKKDGAGGPGGSSGGTTSGITASSGMTGVDLRGRKDDEEEELDEAEKSQMRAVTLRRWRENAKNRLRKGLPPRRFVDPEIPQDVADEIWSKLSQATTVDAVRRAFDR